MSQEDCGSSALPGLCKNWTLHRCQDLHHNASSIPNNGGNMKRSILAVLVFAVIGTAGAVAQYGQEQDHHDQQAQSSHRVRKTNVSGYVRRDGDNYVLENDKDKQRYRIQNSETVRAHEGHHVKVRA